jgi:hypothetical protein
MLDAAERWQGIEPRNAALAATRGPSGLAAPCAASADTGLGGLVETGGRRLATMIRECADSLQERWCIIPHRMPRASS